MRSSLRSLETTASWSRHHFRRKETTRRFARTGYLQGWNMQKKRESLLTMTGVLIRFYCICQVASNDAKIWKEEIFGPVLSGPKINHLAFFAPCSCEENRSFAKTGSGHNRKKENPTKLHHHHHSKYGKNNQPCLRSALCSSCSSYIQDGGGGGADGERHNVWTGRWGLLSGNDIRKTAFPLPLSTMLRMAILPTQARDKHKRRESTQNKGGFLSSLSLSRLDDSGC
jgi:hypothetical protein